MMADVGDDDQTHLELIVCQAGSLALYLLIHVILLTAL